MIAGTAGRPLAELACLVRSKNAGPFLATFDVIFDSPAAYEQVRASGAVSRELIANLCRCAVDDVTYFECDNALALKLSAPRPKVEGAFGDADLHGCQQYAPLAQLIIADNFTAERGIT